MFELENCWTDYDEIWFAHYCGIGVKKLEEKNILLSVFCSIFSFLPSLFSVSLSSLHLIFSYFDFNKVSFDFQSSLFLSQLFINAKHGCKF
jgi:hypothetical protein